MSAWLHLICLLLLLLVIVIIWALTWGNGRSDMGTAPNEDSNQPAHPRSLIRVLVLCMKKPCILCYQITPSEDSDQPAHSRRLIWIIAGRTGPEVRFLIFLEAYFSLLSHFSMAIQKYNSQTVLTHVRRGVWSECTLFAVTTGFFFLNKI